jgi:hypothetical protein
MSKRSVLQRARVRGLTVAGGLLAGMSLLASAPGFPVLATVTGQVQSDSIQPREIFPTTETPPRPGAFRCSKSTRSAMIQKDTDPYGTMGTGFNCTGAPRAVCPGGV